MCRQVIEINMRTQQRFSVERTLNRAMVHNGMANGSRGMDNTARAGTLVRGEPESGNHETSQRDLLELNIEKVPSATLARLIEEVRNETIVGQSYNRSYHRHNR